MSDRASVGYDARALLGAAGPGRVAAADGAVPAVTGAHAAVQAAPPPVAQTGVGAVVRGGDPTVDALKAEARRSTGRSSRTCGAAGTPPSRNTAHA